jgi:hypothetical protein
MKSGREDFVQCEVSVVLRVVVIGRWTGRINLPERTVNRLHTVTYPDCHSQLSEPPVAAGRSAVADLVSVVV